MTRSARRVPSSRGTPTLSLGLACRWENGRAQNLRSCAVRCIEARHAGAGIGMVRQELYALPPRHSRTESGLLPPMVLRAYGSSRLRGVKAQLRAYDSNLGQGRRASGKRLQSVALQVVDEIGELLADVGGCLDDNQDEFVPAVSCRAQPERSWRVELAAQ